MNQYSEPCDDLLFCECSNCKNEFYVPYYEDLPEVSFPSFCCYCGFTFYKVVEVPDEEGH